MTRAVRFTVFLALAVVIVIAVAVVEYLRRGSLYWYDVRQDYVYPLTTGAARRVPVQLTPSGFRLPDLTDPWDTALLPIDLEVTRAGHWFEPSVELRSGRNRSEQYFERGGSGRRFLLIEPRLLETGRDVTMTGRHMRWTSMQSEMLVFSTPEATRGAVLVIAPHPDDAEIAAFGLYSSGDSFVATVSAGNYLDGRYEHLVPEESAQLDLRGKVRAWDSVVVPTWGGVPPERIVNLGYWNNSLAGLFESRDGAEPVMENAGQDPNRFRSGAVAALLSGRRAEATWSSLVEDLRLLIEATDPIAIVAPHPALDAAPDHQFTTVALLEALEALDERDAVLLLYTNHHVLAEYYPFGPADSAMTPPPWFDREQQFGGIYSFPLGFSDRQSKLFALEAMHDLRPAPRTITGEDPLTRLVGQAAHHLREFVGNPFGTYSYYRRAVRANELFFVYHPADRPALDRWTQREFSYR